MLCSNASFTKEKLKKCSRPPWMVHLEDQCTKDEQICVTNQNGQNMKLDIYSNPKIARLTKLMVTLGIMNSYPEAIVAMMMAGVNIVRLNLSHLYDKWHIITVQSVRDAGNRMYEYTGDVYPLGVAMDLRGPEIRLGVFNGDETSIGHAELKEGNSVRVVTNDIAKRAGRADCFWVSYPDLPRICRPGDKILIDRGVALLQVKCICESSIICTVIKGGTVKNGKLVQLLDSVVPLPQISETDIEHMELASMLESDIVIVNHVRNAKIVQGIRGRLNHIGVNKICVMAKISTQQGLEQLDEILNNADGIILDRKSIEIETGPEKLFIVEKVVITKCMNAGKPIMLAFSIECDEDPKVDMNLIANAVLAGTDGIFLKTGALPCHKTVELIKAVDIVCREAETARWQKAIFNQLSRKAPVPTDLSQAIITGAMETSINCKAAAIIITTTTGNSAVLLSTHRPRCPVVAITRYGIIARWLQLYYGLHPYQYRDKPIPDWSKEMEKRIQSGIDFLWRKKIIRIGDAIVVVTGWNQGLGFTNCIRIIYVSPSHIEPEILEYECH